LQGPPVDEHHRYSHLPAHPTLPPPPRPSPGTPVPRPCLPTPHPPWSQEWLNSGACSDPDQLPASAPPGDGERPQGLPLWPDLV
jgi:hypothetical protein